MHLTFLPVTSCKRPMPPVACPCATRLAIMQAAERAAAAEAARIAAALEAAAAALPPEPPAGEGVVNVMVRMPDGGRQGRRFKTSDPLQVGVGLIHSAWLSRTCIMCACA